MYGERLWNVDDDLFCKWCGCETRVEMSGTSPELEWECPLCHELNDLDVLERIADLREMADAERHEL